MANTIFEYRDLRGGYFVDVPSSQLKKNELLVAENCYWANGGLKKRKGRRVQSSVNASAILGTYEGKIGAVASNYIAFAAVNPSGGNGEMWAASVTSSGLGGTWATVTAVASIDCTTFSGTGSVKFAQLGEQIGIVNGVDVPWLIRASGTSLVMDTIEHNDVRTRDNDNWVAGQLDAAQAYTDDTTDAQDAGASDFMVINTTLSSGFMVGCDFTFNRVDVDVDSPAGSTVSCTFEYYGKATASGASGWQTCTMENTPDWDSVATVPVQWAFPIDGDTVLMEQLATDASTMDLKYAFRVYNNMATSTVLAAGLQVQHNQYLSQIFLDDIPDTVAEHKGHLFMGIDNLSRTSPANSLQGWRYADYQYFDDGGKIKDFVSHTDRLIVLLDNHLYGIEGNSWSNWSMQDLSPHGGSVGINSQGVIYYIGSDGFIRMFDGFNNVPISKHIDSDIRGWTATPVEMMEYEGRVWILFPDDDIMLVFDPDTFRKDDVGDGRVSFYKFDPYYVDNFFFNLGNGVPYFTQSTASGIFFGQLEDNTSDKPQSTTTPIQYSIRKPLYYSHEDKQARRVKLQVDDVTATGSVYGTTDISFYKKYPSGLLTHNTSFITPSGTGIHDAEFTLPGKMDGKELWLDITHNQEVGFNVVGFAAEIRKRRF